MEMKIVTFFAICLLLSVCKNTAITTEDID